VVDPQSPDARPPGRAVDHHPRAELRIGNLLQHRQCSQQVPPDEDVTGHVGSCEAQLVGGPQQTTQGMRTGDGQLQWGIRWAKLTSVPTDQAHRCAPAQTRLNQRGDDVRHIQNSLFRL